MESPVILGLVSYKVFPAQMGGQKHIVDFYRALAKQTRLVVAAARENTGTGNELFPVFPFLYNHWKGMLNIFYLFRLRRLIRTHTVDLILVEHSYFGFLAILLRKLTGKPYAIRSQNIEAHRFRDLRRPWWRLYERYERWVHKKADHNFFITAEDSDWAIGHWGLTPEKCSVSTYGTDIAAVLPGQRAAAKQELLRRHALPPHTRIFLFNGTLDYLPNTDALRVILTELLPLLRPKNHSFRIIICGSGLDTQWKKELDACPEVVYAGFVADIRPYFLGADCLINPITLGGGIRTKMIEALAHHQTVISTRSSAHGVAAGTAGNKLIVVPDYDWKAFAGAMLAPELPASEPVPAGFYTAHTWSNIVRQALLSLQAL
ncbi:glycosyltransferase family 4 protein [Sediminibacterium soli]|uniref:glycosyltransferase family 4 protein n=1 Tax=Sediminibacterium soli TaxID=2698829 RepID=UPI00137B54AB|nr:glycosyltransferase family 4 protein [Sediminibacterium soli]NCI46610.1 glycosyltransferase family 4 protein [Sediminibacterium soli]